MWVLRRVAVRINKCRNITTLQGKSQPKNSQTKTAPQLMAALKRCTQTRDLETGKKLHQEAFAAGFKNDRFLAAVIICMYSKCRRMELAQQLFSGLKDPDVVTWNCLIRGYVENGESSKAIETFSRMTSDPDSFTLVAVLKAYGALASDKQLEKVLKIHKMIKERKFGSNLIVANTLVDVYRKCGSMKLAREVFDMMVTKDVYSWTSLVLGYAETGEYQLAMDMFNLMDSSPDPFTYAAVLKSCSGLASQGEKNRSYCLQQAIAIHKRVIDAGFLSDTVVANALLDLYCKCGSITHAEKVFDSVVRKDHISWTCMINGYASNGECSKAVETFFSMKCSPDPYTYVAVLKACTALEDKESCLKYGGEIHRRITEQKLVSDPFLAAALVNMYSKCGSMSLALDVFKSICRKDVVTWNCLLLGHAENGESESAIDLFESMDCKPDTFTHVAVLKACGSLAALSRGQGVHSKLCKLGLEDDQVVATALMDLYVKCGCLSKAEALFYSLHSPDLVSWNAMLAGYASLGDSSRAFELAKKIQDADLQVDGITFVSILTACSHQGLVDDGKVYFNCMSKHGITPTLDHYNCMIDTLGRANRLNEAVSMINSLKTLKPDRVTWMSLLSACRKWKNLEVGKVAFEALVSLGDSRDLSAAYVVMGDIYRTLGMSSDWKRTEEQRMKGKAWKEPGRSWWCDDQGRSTKFVVDGGGSEDIEVRKKLAEVLQGYKSQGGGDESCGHSERLAIAYALLHSAPSQPIRIVNNLRVCIDCHGATGHISKVEKRDIILRDASRFHVFRDGICSCGDYW